MLGWPAEPLKREAPRYPAFPGALPCNRWTDLSCPPHRRHLHRSHLRLCTVLGRAGLHSSPLLLAQLGLELSRSITSGAVAAAAPAGAGPAQGRRGFREPRPAGLLLPASCCRAPGGPLAGGPHSAGRPEHAGRLVGVLPSSSDGATRRAVRCPILRLASRWSSSEEHTEVLPSEAGVDTWLLLRAEKKPLASLMPGAVRPRGRENWRNKGAPVFNCPAGRHRGGGLGGGLACAFVLFVHDPMHCPWFQRAPAVGMMG